MTMKKLGRPRLFDANPIQLTSHVAAAKCVELDAIAEKRGVPRSILLREAIDLFLAHARETDQTVAQAENVES